MSDVREVTRRRTREEGAVAIVAAVGALVFFGLAALVVDLGVARDERRSAQNAADASALAAGNGLYLTGVVPDVAAATAAAKTFAAGNYGITEAEWASCVDPEHFVVPTGSTQCISFRPSLTKPEEVRIRIPVQVSPTGFGAVFGVDGVDIDAVAQARLQVGGASRCGLCVLGSGFDHNLQNGDATVHGADIHFNGSVTVGPNGLVATDGEITIEGQANGSTANYIPNPTTGAPPIADPLGAMTFPPDYSGLTALGDPCTQGPGIYGARSLRNMDCRLEPGLYLIAGGGGTIWDMAGNSSTRLHGDNVTLYFTCGTSTLPRPCAAGGEAGATLDASGSGTLGIRAPSSGPLKGLAIAYDRNNIATLRLTGNGSDNMVGTLYMASGTLQMNGNGCSNNYNALIIAQDVEMNGNPACLQSAYTPSQNVEIPPGAMHLTY